MSRSVKYILIGFLTVICIMSACSTDTKMVSRGEYHGPATLTPFLPKATFTAEATPGGQKQEPGEYSAESTTPIKTNENSQSQQGTLTITLSPTLEKKTSTATFTPTSSATLNPGDPTYTLSPPTETRSPSLTSVPSNTPGPWETPIPPSTIVPTTTQIPSYTSMPANTAAPTNTAVPSNTPLPTNTSPPAGCSPSGNSSYENQVVTLINQERTSRGLSALSQISSLRQAARGHSEDMACNDFFSHTGSNGSSMGSRILAAGYGYSWAAENIAASSSCGFSASSVVNMWMNSAGHKANILSANAVHIGVGFRCVNDGASGDLDAYYTANFGKP